jgi:hypothetical protein
MKISKYYLLKRCLPSSFLIVPFQLFVQTKEPVLWESVSLGMCAIRDINFFFMPAYNSRLYRPAWPQNILHHSEYVTDSWRKI